MTRQSILQPILLVLGQIYVLLTNAHLGAMARKDGSHALITINGSNDDKVICIAP